MTWLLESVDDVHRLMVGRPAVVVGPSALEVLERAYEVWSSEPEWAQRVSRELVSWGGTLPATTDPASVGALLDPRAWRRKWEIEVRAARESEGVRTRSVPLGTVLHLCPGNGVSTSIWSMLHGFVAGNRNLVRLSAKAPSVAPVIVELLRRCGAPEDQVVFVSWDVNDASVHGRLLASVDGIAAWGRAETLAAVRRAAPPAVRLIEHGAKLSVSVLTRVARGDAVALDGLAADACDREQLACSSTQCLLVEVGEDEDPGAARREALEHIGAAMARYARANPPGRRSVDAQVEVLKAHYLATLDQARGEAWVLDGFPDFLVVWRDTGPIEPSSLFRTLQVRSYRASAELSALLGQVRHHLQTATLACGPDEGEAYRTLLWSAGVDRVTTAGGASGDAVAAPLDGRYLLPEFQRVVSWEPGATER